MVVTCRLAVTFSRFRDSHRGSGLFLLTVYLLFLETWAHFVALTVLEHLVEAFRVVLELQAWDTMRFLSFCL